MKNLIKIMVVLMIISLSSNIAQNGNSENVESGKFVVIVSGFDSDEGNAMIALYNSEENYSENGEKFKRTMSKIKDSKVEWIIEDLPFGEYAIKLYHDENENGRMDRNMMGIPKEDYAFSNNATGSFGPADYDDAKFEFVESGQKQEISIN
ncbi:MAG: DUF2141 domain-containing protein [Melioribacteraceae bacterium]|nr:DUF2141 domain-containing protein [Melioribacteraceae bacterium]